ncbi:MAG: hypothetical protein P1T08_02515 [Acidimicrobiia bacterium]|nr:hypothetical protein [Acidimicrobiia bacterium]
MIETTTINALLIVGGIAGFGGLAGGMLSGRRATVAGSILIGIIGGLVTTVILSALEGVPRYLAIGDYSAIWALAGGAVISFLVGYTNQ